MPRTREEGVSSVHHGGTYHRGFTIIELIAVLIILGMLAALAIPMYFGALNKAKVAKPLRTSIR